MARKTAFYYNRSHDDYSALEKLPAPIRYALYESVNDYSAPHVLRQYNKAKKAWGEVRAIAAVIRTIRTTDKERVAVQCIKTDRPLINPLYNYHDHVVMASVKGAY